MRNLYELVVVLSIGSAGLAACQIADSPSQGAEAAAEEADDLSAQDWQVLHTLSPLPAVPEDRTNKYADSPAAARLGQKLFFESTLSGPIPTGTAQGSLWMTRNVSSVVNTVFYINAHGGAHWRENDGFSDSEWFDAQSEPEGPPVQNGSRLQLAHVLFDHYRADYDAAFPDWPLDPGLADLARFPATGSPYTDAASWNRPPARSEEHTS